MIAKFKKLAHCLSANIATRSFLNDQTQEQLDLVQKTYKDLVELSHMKYPTSTLKTIEDIEEGFKYNRSSLGLWGLQNAFYKGAYKVRTTNFDHIKEIKA